MSKPITEENLEGLSSPAAAREALGLGNTLAKFSPEELETFKEIFAGVSAFGVNPPETVKSTSDDRTKNNSTRSTYRILTDEEKVLMDRLKTAGSDFIAMCHDIGGTDSSGDRLASRDLSLAVTHMEDAVMRAVRHLTK